MIAGTRRREAALTRAARAPVAVVVIMALVAATVISIGVSVGLTAEQASARGPAYPGPQATATSPSYFGPAPNPLPYCDNPTYFDPWEENITPVGRFDVGDTATVTTDGMTMTLELIAEGNPGTQYPGFFPFAGEGVETDRPKGIEMAEGDSARITLDQPLFYSQWIFTDVDQPGEGFQVVPDWAVVGEVIAYGGDGEFTFEGTTRENIRIDDLDGVPRASELVEGRAQLDMLGAVNGITMTRTSPSEGQSGVSVAGGCEASGAAKVVVDGPTWNGTSFDVTYELRLRNNMPTEATILEVVEAAQANAQSTFSTAPPSSIPLEDLRLTDQLADPAFSAITVTGLSSQTAGLILNEQYNGLDDDELFLAGSELSAETEALVTLSVQYQPDLATADWVNCTTGYDYLNQSVVSGTIGGIPVTDQSDNGTDPTPSSENGEGGVDDPTPVLFPCIPAGLDIVKTVVAGPAGQCPAFEDGVRGEGTPLPVFVDDVVTYCISVSNTDQGTASNVVISDPQAPDSFAIGQLDGGQSETVAYDLTVALDTEPLNTATATGTGAQGALGPVIDTAAIVVSPKPQPVLEIVKTALAGPTATCPDFDNGVLGRGDALAVDEQDVVTYCITVRNSGDGAATNVVITDDQAPQDYAVVSLAPGQEETVSYDLTVDIATGPINVAFANGSGPDGALEEVSDLAVIQVARLQPTLEIVKTALQGPGAVCPAFVDGVPGDGDPVQLTDGDTVTYCVSVRNSGRGIASNLIVSDAQAPSPVSLGALLAGQELGIQYDVPVTLDTPETNTAVATGDGPTGELAEVSDTAVIEIEPLPTPVLEIVKTALRGPTTDCPDFDNGVVGQGDAVQFVETETVTYCITVRNVGQGPATDVLIRDAQAPNGFDLAIGDLASGQTETRLFDLEVFVTTPTINTAFVTGVGPYEPTAEVSDDALIAVSLRPDPELEIVKTVVEGPNGVCPAFAAGVVGDGDPLPVLYGDTVTYCISVTNSGENEATSVVVVDQQAPGAYSIGVLPVGEEVTRSYDLVVDADSDDVNTATVNGRGPNGDLGEKSDRALIDPSPQPDPVLEIVKTVVEGPNGDCPAFADGVVGDGDPLPVFYGDTVTYCISVTNTGARDAVDVVIADAQSPDSPYEFSVFGVGGVVDRSYDLVIDADSEDVNTATVNGRGPNGDLEEKSDRALIDPSPQPDPQLNIVKTVVLGPNGNCPAYDDGIAGLGDALKVELGDTVTYCISVRNTGARTATNVVIADEQAPESPYTIGDVGVGETVDRAYDLVVDADTKLVNVATVNGEGPNGELPEDEDDARIDTAEIKLVHTVTRLDQPCDDTVRDVDILVVDLAGLDVRWCYRITNTGTVPLTNILLTSEGLGFVDLDALANLGTAWIVDADGELQQVFTAEAQPAGQVFSANAEPGDIVLLPDNTIFIEIQSTIVEGGFESVANVIADPSDENGVLLGLDPVTDIDEAEVQEGLIQLDKRVVAGADGDCTQAVELIVIAQGEPVTWCFTVENIGMLDVLITEIVDDTLGFTVPVPDALQTLPPEQSYTLSQSGESPGAIVNTAAITGQALDGLGNVIAQAPTLFDDDPAELQVPAANIALDKSVSDRGPVPRGTELTYTIDVTNAGAGEARDVLIADQLPVGLSYVTVPDVEGWVCALTNDGRGFTCLKSTALAAGATAQLTYLAVIDDTAPDGTEFTNVASVSTSTEDTDPSDNVDTETTTTETPETPPQPTPEPPTDRPEYPGPFTQPEPPAPPPPDEVLGLAITGSSSALLALLSMAMLATGSALSVIARRSRDELID